MGDSTLLSTGYSNQLRSIMKHLSNKPRKWDVHQCAWHYYGQPIKDATFEDGEKLNYWIHPTAGGQWGQQSLQHYIRKLNPDVFFTLCDSFMLLQDGQGGPVNNWIFNIDFSPAKSILYFPSDGEPFPLGCEKIFKKFDYGVSMSKFGQEQLMRDFKIKTDYIPHCVDTNIFYKMDVDKEVLRRKWSPLCQDSERRPVNLVGKRIILCVARNQMRKFLFKLVHTAVKFFKNPANKDVIFLLKSQPDDPASGMDLLSMAKQYGISDKFCWVYSQWFSGFTQTDMREIYNLADVFALGTSGEGFGIPFIEAMSCELPIVVTNFTSPNELVDGDDKQLAKLQTTITGSFNVERGCVDVDDMSNKLQYFLDHVDEIKSTGRSNRDKVLREYSTKVVLPKWEKYIEERVYR